MTRALTEFLLLAGEIETDLAFLNRALELRPRIFQVLNFENRGETLDLARKFGDTADVRPALFFGPMLIRLTASFERYLRMLVQEVVERWAQRAQYFDKLPQGLAERNVVLSGRALANSDSPRDHMTFDLDEIIDNLLTCRSGRTGFRLNSGVFMDLIYGITPDVIESSLRTVRVTSWENVVGADRTLQERLGVNRVPDATKAIATRMKRLSRWRNNWAHGGDDQVSLTFEEISGELNFLRAFATALDSAVLRHLQSARLP